MIESAALKVLFGLFFWLFVVLWKMRILIPVTATVIASLCFPEWTKENELLFTIIIGAMYIAVILSWFYTLYRHIRLRKMEQMHYEALERMSRSDAEGI